MNGYIKRTPPELEDINMDIVRVLHKAVLVTRSPLCGDQTQEPMTLNWSKVTCDKCLSVKED